MKKLILLAIFIITSNSYAGEAVTKSFSSAEKCQHFAFQVIGENNEKSLSQLFSDVGIEIEEGSEMSMLIAFADKQKEGAGEFKYLEEIGVSALGDFIKRVGFIAKYKELTIFYEVTIGKKGPEDYSIVNMSFDYDRDAHNVIKDIPKYYWK